MRGFSWCLLDTKKELVKGQKFKVLVPKEIVDCFEDRFLGVLDEYRGYFVGIYEDYGSHTYLCPPDLYEALVMMNDNIDIKVDGYGNDTYKSMPVTVDVYNHEMSKAKYPLRLTSIDDDKSYEDYEGLFSVQVPSQSPNADTVYDDKLFQVTYYDMSGMFDNNQTTDLDLSDFDTSNIADVGRMFEGSQATTLDLSDLDTSKEFEKNRSFRAIKRSRR